MIQTYKGHFDYRESAITALNSGITGVYYCGALTITGSLVPYYVGRAIGEDGIRGRVLDHHQEDYWPDVTHFGFEACSTASEAIQHEANEIARYKPKYNKQGL